MRGDSFNRLQRCYERDEDVTDAFFDLAENGVMYHLAQISTEERPAWEST